MAIAAPSAAHAPPGEWISPEEQIRRLTQSWLTEQLRQDEPGHILNTAPRGLHDQISASLARSVLRGSILTEPGSEDDSNRISSLFDLCVQRLFQLDPFPPILTDWAIALERTGALPDEVPALPHHMIQILNAKCPIWGDKKKADGTYNKCLDTWRLSLKIPETMTELESRVRAYGNQALNDRGEKRYPIANPLEFRYFELPAFSQHARLRSKDVPYWILHTHTVLPGSWEGSCHQKFRMVEDLRKSTFIDFKVPLLSETATVSFDREIAGGEQPYPVAVRGAKGGRYSIYTLSREVAEDDYLIFGGSALNGPLVRKQGHFHCLYGPWRIGISACRRF